MTIWRRKSPTREPTFWKWAPTSGTASKTTVSPGAKASSRRRRLRTAGVSRRARRCRIQVPAESRAEKEAQMTSGRISTTHRLVHVQRSDDRQRWQHRLRYALYVDQRLRDGSFDIYEFVIIQTWYRRPQPSRDARRQRLLQIGRHRVERTSAGGRLVVRRG